MNQIKNSILHICVIAFIFLGMSKAVWAQNDQKQPHILLITAADSVETALWYRSIDEYARLASDALEVELEHMFVGSMRADIMDRVKGRLSQEPRPDYLILDNMRGLGVELLRLAEAEKIQTFLYMTPLTDEDYKLLGGPRADLKYWIAQLIPDDVTAGYDLANYLIAHARDKKAKLNDTTPIKMIGILGRPSTSASPQREIGLKRAVAENPDVILLQSVAGRWMTDIATTKYLGLKRRYNDIDIVWCANDDMALGVAKVAADESIYPSIGGVDWIPPALEGISTGAMAITMGGHSFDIAYVIAMLRHHYDGGELSDGAGGYSFSSQLMPLNQDNIDFYNKFMEQKALGNIDFEAGFEGFMDTSSRNEMISMKTFVEKSMANATQTEIEAGL